jgi:CRISPR-associated endonuclease Csn1
MNKSYSGQPGTILGLDLGTNSVGWCLLSAAWNEEDKRYHPVGIQAMGSRIFEAGTEGDIKSGGDESRATKRREARLIRRGLARRAGRMHRLFLKLVELNLLPTPVNRHQPLATQIHTTLTELDQQLARSGWDASLLTYQLRAAAIQKRLKPYELGRTLYALAQRRGFLSNRKSQEKKDEDLGEVKGVILELEQTIEATQTRTLGAYLAGLNPNDHTQEHNRLRGRYVSRKMIQDEFDLILSVQKPHHDIPEKEFQNIRHIIFYQRPLKSSSHLIGYCELEKGKKITFNNSAGRKVEKYKAPRRLPMADLLAQELRVLQKANDLLIIYASGQITPFNQEQKDQYLKLAQNGDVKLSELKKTLGLSPRDKINLGEGGESKLPGFRTASRIRESIGADWDSLSDDQKQDLVTLLRTEDDLVILDKIFRRHWNFSSEQIESLKACRLEDSYLAFSRQAVSKLLPHLRQGISLQTAIKQEYGEQEDSVDPQDSLPRIYEALPQLKNPVVARTLTEVRKIVNSLIKEYGKPAEIRIELVRDMKKSRASRQEITKLNRTREGERNKAKEHIAKAGIAPRESDILKWRLAEECNFECPYTGRSFGAAALFSSTSPLDIEHIIPFSISFDDSFANKTICWAEENRNIKKNRAPAQAYSPENLKPILKRVANFKGEYASEKLRRFQLDTFDGDFTQRQLSDTAYATKAAAHYLSLLYGQDSKQRIFTTKGQVTSIIRRYLKLNQVLGDSMKTRDDHRHHTIDALVVGLSTPSLIKQIGRAVEQKRQIDPILIQEPWTDFIKDTQAHIDNVIVSHRSSRKVNKRLHKETFYGTKDDQLGTQRVSLDKLTVKDIDKIINNDIRKRVSSALKESGEKDPAKAFNDIDSLPQIQTPQGARPIKKTKIAVVKPTLKVGENHRTRYADSDGNHHLEIVETIDEKGASKWQGIMVTHYEALQRLKIGQPIVNTQQEGFKFSLSYGDTIQYCENKVLYYGWVRGVSNEKTGVRIQFVPHSDARPQGPQKKAKAFKTISLNQCKQLDVKKVCVDPIGRVRFARD